jgi:hypothetical protein
MISGKPDVRSAFDYAKNTAEGLGLNDQAQKKWLPWHIAGYDHEICFW